MRCFNHAHVEAVATCKHCFKGICRECAIDSGCGLACSPLCADEIKSLNAMINRSKKMYPIAAKNQFRSAIWLLLTAAIFITLGLWIRDDFRFMAFFIGMGVLMLLGSIFAFLNSRKIARLTNGNTAVSHPKEHT
jgi:hypothetical protein